MKRLIKIAHSPDSDDAYMFYALKHGKVRSDKYDFDIERQDIEELNHLALKEVYDITAISFHAYAHLNGHYALLSSGSSMAEKDYGPMVVSRISLDKDLQASTRGKLIAVPGEWTTAFLLLKMAMPDIRHKVVPFQDIIPAVLAKQADAGLIIHEGQLQYQKQGLFCIIKLIDVWKDLLRGAGQPELPLPLGGNAVKKSLGLETMKELSSLMRESILYASAHHEEAREYARQFKRDLSDVQADQYLSWYANDRTLNLGSEEKAALEFLYDAALTQGVLDKKIGIEIV